jgi:hypothetical protein
VRGRGNYYPDFNNASLNFVQYGLLFELDHFIRDRKMMLGINEAPETALAGASCCGGIELMLARYADAAASAKWGGLLESMQRQFEKQEQYACLIGTSQSHHESGHRSQCGPFRGDTLRSPARHPTTYVNQRM